MCLKDLMIFKVKEKYFMKELIFSKDKYKMNWLREDCEYAKIKCPQKLEYKVSSERG